MQWLNMICSRRAFDHALAVRLQLNATKSIKSSMLLHTFVVVMVVVVLTTHSTYQKYLYVKCYSQYIRYYYDPIVVYRCFYTLNRPY